MKVVKEILLLNDLKDTLDLVKDDEIYIVQRKENKDAVIMSLDKYNEINKALYEAKNKD